MKSHALRPLFVVIVVLVIILIFRTLIVPKDFGIHLRDTPFGSYIWGYYRKGDEDYWKAFKVKHQTMNYCKDCHSEQYKKIINSKHAKVQCENCHGPAVDHPEKPEKLNIDRNRELCLRCHAYLPYRTAKYELRGVPITLKMQDPDAHNTGIECVACHSPHEASLK
ncbi:MAG: cytochrome c3 family protein [Nitrospirae bacterium]|nr:cytochrome c3 family protein [Nitrospirota bacterium]